MELLLGLAGLAALAGFLFWLGVIPRAIRLAGVVMMHVLHWGFAWWRRLLSWLPWPFFLLVVAAIHFLIWYSPDAKSWPSLLGGIVLIYIGLITCLACIFLDLERTAVSRGYMVFHNPGKGQRIAQHLATYGHRAGMPMLLVANVAIISGFALLNRGLYYTIGASWYVIGAQRNVFPIEPAPHAVPPDYFDFLAYAFINIFRIVDLVDVANTYNRFKFTYVHQIRWPAATLLLVFKSFYTLVLIQQFVSAVRRFLGLQSILQDFWNPHEPIHERAQATLAQYGLAALPPLFASLEEAEMLPASQRARLVEVVAALGPGAGPLLVTYLVDPRKEIRAVSIAALGRLRNFDSVREWANLASDPSEEVRLALVEALESLCQKGERQFEMEVKQRDLSRSRAWMRRYLTRVRRSAAPTTSPLEDVVALLRRLTIDAHPGIRARAAGVLSLLGTRADSAVPELCVLLRDEEEEVRCEAAAALGKLRKVEGDAAAILMDMLDGPTPRIKLAALEALKSSPAALEAATPRVIPLLHDREEAVRDLVFASLSQMESLPAAARPILLAGLQDEDNQVRARTAEALGALGSSAEETMPALIKALDDANDRVRGKAAEALGKMAPTPASVAALQHGLDDEDNRVRAQAALALGSYGAEARPALVALLDACGHSNSHVRGNAIEAIERILATGPAPAELDERCRQAITKSLVDEDVAVRSQAVAHLSTCQGMHVEPWLVTCLGDEAPQVRAAAAQELGELASLSPRGIHALVQSLDDGNDEVQMAAARALAKKAAPTPDVLSGLADMLKDANPDVQLAAAQSLGQFGTQAQEVGAQLLDIWKTGTTEMREQTLRSLAMILSPQAAETFVAGLLDPEPAIRKLSSAGLLKVDAIPDDALPHLVEALRDPEPQIRSNIALWLRRLETLPEAAIPLLIEATTDPDEGLRLNAVRALRTTSGSEVEAAWEGLLHDHDMQVRVEAAILLAQHQPSHVEAAEIVIQVLGTPAYPQRKNVLSLLEMLSPLRTPLVIACQQWQAVETDAGMAERLKTLIDAAAAYEAKLAAEKREQEEAVFTAPGTE